MNGKPSATAGRKTTGLVNARQRSYPKWQTVGDGGAAKLPAWTYHQVAGPPKGD